MTAIHDTAVDGMAVRILASKEHAIGAYGQYAGYKFEGLETGGLLPLLFGESAVWKV
jgi:hypothetical protein